jgi:cytochrome c biogenesis protein CcmG, thiol:disulfide interchange protein DsbE
MKRLLSPVVLVVLLCLVGLVWLFAYGVRSQQPSQSLDAAVAQGKRVPLSMPALPRLDGGSQLSASSLGGKVVVLNAWASWCQPCRAEAPLLESWQRRLAPANSTVVGVDALDLESDARGFASQYGLSYPIVRDNSAGWLKTLGVVGYPETFVIDRKGRVAAVARGPVTDSFFSTSVLPLLGEGA